MMGSREWEVGEWAASPHSRLPTPHSPLNPLTSHNLRLIFPAPTGDHKGTLLDKVLRVTKFTTPLFHQITQGPTAARA